MYIYNVNLIVELNLEIRLVCLKYKKNWQQLKEITTHQITNIYLNFKLGCQGQTANYNQFCPLTC
jgi:hypothetical protein